MKKMIMHWFVLFIFVNKIVHIIGKVTLLSGSISSKSYSRIICLSEDDGGALVWNYAFNDFQLNYFKIFENDFRFHDINNSFNNNEINCKMNAEENCLTLWRRDDWNLTDSIKTPMGPVFDQRWEDFKEYNYNPGDDYKYISQLPITLSLSFSVRTSHHAHILICNGQNYNKDFCYRITIDSKNEFVIRKCANGMNEWLIPYLACEKVAVSYKTISLSDNVWRSFILSWDAIFRTIIIYDTDESIITYKDLEENERSNYDYHMFIASYSSMFRFHIYNFLHTNVETATLLSPAFQFNNKPICIQLLIGLCNECNAHVLLRDSTTHKTIEMVTVEGSSEVKVHRLPMWQSVKIKSHFSANNYSSVIIQLIPKLIRNISKPLWAIANVRQCPQNEALRKGVLNYNVIDKRYWDKGDRIYFLPETTCQKLFYNEHTLVSSKSRLERNIKLDDADCPQDKIGPQCLLSCEGDLNSDVNCQNITICYEDGCTCSPGFWGEGCSSPCTSNTYGHGCKNICGLCKGSCNKITGICNEGCNNYRKTHIPPMCQISIDKPSTPVITSTSETTINAIVPMIWKDEYDNISIFYSFDIKGQMQYDVPHSWNRIFRNMTQLIGFFKNLEPGAIYQISCNLLVENELIYGDWKIVETQCNPAENFIVTPGETELVINWDINSNQLHPCPKSSYHLIVRNINTNREVSESNMYFPYTLQHLPSYTNFNVTMYHKSYKIFTQEIRTLDNVSSRVLTDTEVTLTWRPPSQSNITQYEVILKVIESYGCRDLNLTTPNNRIINISTTDTMITISDLHPYTSYSAQIIAHNSQNSHMIAGTTFATAESKIPSEVINNLRAENGILSWEAPKDCTTISGPIKTKIIVHGISDSVKNESLSVRKKLDKRNFLNLNTVEFAPWKKTLAGAERYLIKVYVARDVKNNNTNKIIGNIINKTAFVELECEIPPRAPPKVNNLEVVEIDTREKPVIHLRWKSPLPPLNGKLRDYGIQLCDTDEHCKNLKNHTNKSCDLWEDYICEIVQKPTRFLKIQVFAYNMNVTEPGPSAFVTEEMLVNIEPEAPSNCTFTMNNNSIVDLKWLHPWKTGDHLRSFRIQLVEMSSDLKKRLVQGPTNKNTWTYEYPVAQYMYNYSKRLYLYPSTKYLIYVQTVTIANRTRSSNSVEIYTPSTTYFDGDLNVRVQKSNSISLNIPSVVNDTQGSIMFVIVKGPNPCDQHLNLSKNLQVQAGLKMDEVAWLAAEVPINELAGKRFIVGDNKVYGNATNCPLQPNELYEIIVMIIETNLSNKPIILAKLIRTSKALYHEVWFVPLVIYLIIASISFYLCRRKCRQSAEEPMQYEIPCQNIQKSEEETRYESIYMENEYESIYMESIVSYSEQDQSSISDRQSLSNEIISEELSFAMKDNEEEEEIISLVEVKDFEDYVKQAIQSGLLDKQYKMLPRGQTQESDYGKLPENKLKNRYKSLTAYDKTRVVLEKLPDNAYSDYINANYITGYKMDKCYIATQGPKPSTVLDFWRMIWQENVLIICMLTNIVESGKTKCAQYWPDIKKKKKYGDIIVLNAKHNVFADYCFRTFYVTYGEETRKIEHLHYTAWPDYSMPLYTHSIVTYLKKLLAISSGKGPVAVHCSAGIGRTGIIILCDICLRRAAAEKAIMTLSITSERANMINNTQQYILAHLILIECLFSISTSLPCDKTLPMQIKELKKQLPIQQQRLQNIWQDKVLQQVTPLPSLSERNRAKNRFPELISNINNRIYLTRYSELDEDSDYLSAVYVDGVRFQNQYLATQLPMPSTINDFWRMIAELKVELIVMLQPPDLQDFTCCSITLASNEFKPTPYLTIRVRETVKMEYYTSQKLLLIDNSEELSREQSVTILNLTEWKPGKNQPPPPVTVMVKFWHVVGRIAKGDGPIVTLCHDGVTGCGLYLAMSFLLERMAIKRECDVCMAVRVVKQSRSDFVHSLEQLEYLYNAALIFMNFESYANFS
ncbi:hypothetical protein P5V15_004035 [Pogonomyrmex californicus]